MSKISYTISQNFLTSGRTIDRLLRLTSISGGDDVIEIGAGKGHITRKLLGRCGKLTAFEIDPKLAGEIETKYGAAGNLTLKRQDFLKAQLPKKEEYKVFSNIPFSITTAIMNKLITDRNPPAEAWLIMEKGAAKRFMGKPFETRASLLLKPYFEISIKYYFSRYDFHPSPAVDAVLVYLRKKTTPDIPLQSRREYNDFIVKGLMHGPKSLMSERRIASALRRAALPQIRESGMILYIQWLCLFRSIICSKEC